MSMAGKQSIGNWNFTLRDMWILQIKMDSMRFKQLRAIWVHVELILCIISSFSLEISKNWTFRHRKSGCFHIFMWKGRGENGGKGMKFIHCFFVVLSMRKQKRKGRLGYILQERSSCWHIVFWGSSCKEDSG